MSELLLELFSEEIPARMQAKAEADLLAALTARLKEAGLGWKTAFAVSGPRRLTAVIEGLDARSADVREEKKGPKVGAPEQAIAGFLRGAGLTSIDQAGIVSDAKKGDSYVAYLSVPGRDAVDVIAEAVPAIVRGFNWPKSMRTADGDLRWVRPLKRIVCVLDGAIVPFEVGGMASGNVTEGHRVHGRGPYTVKAWADYKKQLEGKGHVILSRADRRTRILEGIADVCAKAGLELVPDEGLLEEVTGLAEWPVVVLGQMEPSFLDLPPEVIRLSMRTHQKYFAVRRPGTEGLAPNFIVVANISASDGGVKIAEGNARVLSARLSDARFFWEKDKATPLDVMGEKLKTIAFKEELGSLGDKIERVAALARELALKVGADPELAERAARLAKADLVSEMVGEFPELQGVMGRYYALAAGEKPNVADAIRDHYKPQGPNDAVPSEPVAVAVALADKLDTLVGFWAIDEKPTGSKDPFALRRAALGVVRTILENSLSFRLDEALIHARGTSIATVVDEKGNRVKRMVRELSDWPFNIVRAPQNQTVELVEFSDSAKWNLLSFFADRLKQALRDRGKRHDLIEAVLSRGDDDLKTTVRRVDALTAFLDSDDGANLLTGYRRANNLVKSERQKGKGPDVRSIDAVLFDLGTMRNLGPTQQQALVAALLDIRPELEAALAAQNFERAMSILARLRVPVDAFLESVLVNDPDPEIRSGRLALLDSVSGEMNRVADFSKIEG